MRWFISEVFASYSSSFLQNYTENFIQSILDSIDAKDATLVVGGDGRYFSPEVAQIILKIGTANGVAKFIIGKDAAFVRLMDRPVGDADLARRTIERLLDLIVNHPEMNELKHTTVAF